MEGHGALKFSMKSYFTFREHTLKFITARKRNLVQGNIFAPVCHSVHRGGTWAGTPSAGPPGQVLPWQVHPPAGTPPGSACWNTVNKRTSGWYASYWNAFLFRRFFAEEEIVNITIEIEIDYRWQHYN